MLALSMLSETLVMVAFIVILPLIPSFILYKLLPAKTAVSGPFRGLKIHLSGAFAAYFLILLITIGFVSARPKQLDYEIWEIKGSFKANEGDPDKVKQKLQLSVVPPSYNTFGDGKFDVLIAKKPNGGSPFPYIVLEHPDFQTITLDLNDGGFGQKLKHITIDKENKLIKVEDPIVFLKKEPDTPYNPQGPALQQVSGLTPGGSPAQ